MKIRELGVASVGLLLLLAALSTISPAAAKGIVNVSIPNGSGSNTSSPGYSPRTITVVLGINETVMWVNNDTAIHTVTSDDNSTFSSGNLAPNQSYSFSFATPGTYTYHCIYHTWMHGTVIVKPNSAVPEFPASTLALLLFGVIAVAAVASGSLKGKTQLN